MSENPHTLDDIKEIIVKIQEDLIQHKIKHNDFLELIKDRQNKFTELVVEALEQFKTNFLTIYDDDEGAKHVDAIIEAVVKQNKLFQDLEGVK